jgi:hypothetical protein
VVSGAAPSVSLHLISRSDVKRLAVASLGSAVRDGDQVREQAQRRPDGRIWFPRAAPLLRVKNWRALGEVSHTYQLTANETYIPADMNGAGGWRWAAEGFAYLNQDAYIAGDFYITAPPVVPGSGIVQFQIAAAPRIEAAQETERGSKDAPSDTRMTVWIYTPNGSNFRLEDLAGRPIRAHSIKNAGEHTVVEIEAADTVVMTIIGL